MMGIAHRFSYTGPRILAVRRPEDQGRALVLNGLLEDSNGELHDREFSRSLRGIYNVRIEALQPHGMPIAVGWLLLDVR
jgi:hypothetical protein